MRQTTVSSHDGNSEDKGDRILEEQAASSTSGTLVDLPTLPTTMRQKVGITIMASAVSFLSLFAVGMYFPVIEDVGNEIQIDNPKMYSTIAAYMIFQAISPPFWGYWADIHGRRPIFLLSLLLYNLSNVGLALTYNYPMLLCFRILQAFATSSTIGAGAGIIADITTPDERGSFQGWYSLGSTLGAAIGPMMGGLISQRYGWRSPFWCLCVLSLALWWILFFFLPETLEPHPHKQQGPHRTGNKEKQFGKKDMGSRSTWSLCLFPLFESVSFVKYKDVLNVVLLYGFQYASGYAVTVMTPVVLCGPGYDLEATTIGFTYLAHGGGCFLASILQGFILNHDYHQLHTLSDSFIVYARLRRVLPNALAHNVLLVVYGWCVYTHAPLALLLAMHFFLGATSQSILNSIQVLLTDLFPYRIASITACNNFYRCLFGAFATATIRPACDVMGYGWSYSLVSGILLCSRLCLALEIKYGSCWQQDRSGEKPETQHDVPS